MNTRMSRLRRSISRSVHAISAIRGSQNSLNGLIDLPTSSTHSTLVDRFATPSNFPQLKQLVQDNNESLREIVAVFEEKAALDFHYSKTLKKLAARLHRVTQNADCEIDKGWTSVAEQFDIHATLHSNLGSALTDDIVQPLRSIQTNEQKTIRAAESFVEKETRKLKTKKEDTMRLKATLFKSSKELERVEASADIEKTSPNRLDLRRKKLREQVKKDEDAYVWDTIDLEKQRRVTESVLRKGVESLEAVERQRLAHCQTAIGRYQRKIEQLGPNLQQMFERHTNNLDLAVEANASDYVFTIQPGAVAVSHVYLTDLYAEDFGEIINSERRKNALERVSGLLDSELQRVYAQGRADTLVGNCRQMTMIEFIEYLYYKVNDSLNSLEGGQHKGFHRLARFQHKLKDKMGLPMTVLSLPLTGEDQSLPPPSMGTPSITPSHYAPGSSRTGSDEYEDYDKISDEGFYNSNSNSNSSRQTTIIDEPAAHATLCRVLYDFEPKHDDEILVRAGDCVLVEDRIGDDWLIGHVVNNQCAESKTGRFPTSYVAFG